VIGLRNTIDIAELVARPKPAFGKPTDMQIISFFSGLSYKNQNPIAPNCMAVWWLLSDHEAFDTIPRAKLWRVLEGLGIHGEMFHAIQYGASTRQDARGVHRHF
jgi:hypothetical protein